MWRAMMDVFWNEHVWLPPNTTWEDVEPSPDKPIAYADHRILVYYSIPFGLMLIILRHLLDKYVYVPFGILIGVKNVIQKKTPHNPKLEAAYQSSTKIEYKKITALSKQLDMTERQVERWWRLRRSQDKPSNMVKFCENMWLLTIYLYNFLFGLTVLWNKEWLWDIDYCFIGFPHQGLTNDVMYYYMISTGLYWSQAISILWDVRRKDFWQIVLHHIVTLMLLYISWFTNMYRFGSVILLLTDFVDIFLNVMKAVAYSKYKEHCEVLFLGQFTVAWVITRLILYPYYILRKSFHAPSLAPMYALYYLIVVLLHMLMVFFIIWTWFIMKILYRMVTIGGFKDERSSNSEISDNDCNNSVSNGNHYKK